MKKTLSLLALLGACAAMLPQAWAEADAAKPKAAAKHAIKPSAKPAAKKKADKAETAAKTAEPDEDDVVPDLAGSSSVDYQCALGDKVTLYENLSDDKHIAVRWGKQLHRLKRIDTTTGANRFENRKHGLVWIGIPAKGMLLDSKKGQQLANDCKNSQQLMAKPATVEPGAGSLLAGGNK